jgi:phage-related minor tail protein
MTSAIDKFVETGKFSFSDFAKSVIQDMIKIELKAQASKLLGGLTGSGGLFSSIGSLFGLASGGPVDANTPYIVGEKGPELFVPPSAGKIIPNNKISSQSQGISTTGMSAPVSYSYITNNISAVDGASVAKLFADNRRSLLGATQLAQKELPYGNR